MYIGQDKRRLLDTHIEGLFDTLRQLALDDPEDSMDANIAYVLSTVLNVVYAGDDYDDVKEALGLLASVELEYTRTVAAPVFAQLCYDQGEVFGEGTRIKQSPDPIELEPTILAFGRHKGEDPITEVLDD